MSTAYAIKNYLVLLMMLMGLLKGYSQEASLSRWVIGMETGKRYSLCHTSSPSPSDAHHKTKSYDKTISIVQQPKICDFS